MQYVLKFSLLKLYLTLQKYGGLTSGWWLWAPTWGREVEKHWLLLQLQPHSCAGNNGNWKSPLAMCVAAVPGACHYVSAQGEGSLKPP